MKFIIGKSEFDKKIWNKENSVFLIETDKNILFGGFISSKIDKIYIEKPTEYKSIRDEKAFVFTIKDNQMNKFPINIGRPSCAFCLCQESNERLFKFGINDININKYNEKCCVYQDKYSSFEYENNSYSPFNLIGIDGFFPKRILVFQMN